MPAIFKTNMYAAKSVNPWNEVLPIKYCNYEQGIRSLVSNLSPSPQDRSQEGQLGIRQLETGLDQRSTW